MALSIGAMEMKTEPRLLDLLLAWLPGSRHQSNVSSAAFALPRVQQALRPATAMLPVHDIPKLAWFPSNKYANPAHLLVLEVPKGTALPSHILVIPQREVPSCLLVRPAPRYVAADEQMSLLLIQRIRRAVMYDRR